VAVGIGDVMTLFQGALLTSVALAGPVLAFGLVAGLLVSIFQAVTQIHEMTLTFVPKVAAVVLCLILFLPWMLQKLMAFTITIFEYAARAGVTR
jgi:flagellar biosynthetic protein FliQ